MSRTSERVKKVIIEKLVVDEFKVTDGASFMRDLDADSFEIIELIMALEDEFGTEIPDATAERMLTVDDAIRFFDVVGRDKLAAD